MTFAPIIKRADRRGVSPWLTATLIVVVLVAAVATAATLLSAPLIAWIDRAPEIAARVKEKLYVLDIPLAALRDLQHTLMPPSANSVKVETSQITLVAPVDRCGHAGRGADRRSSPRRCSSRWSASWRCAGI